jgi:hypothetical protein
LCDVRQMLAPTALVAALASVAPSPMQAWLSLLLSHSAVLLACVAGAQVLQEMLDMLRDHQNNFHTARLEWVVSLAAGGLHWGLLPQPQLAVGP